VHPINGIVGQPEEGVWVGTSGGTDEGRKCAFGVMWKSLRKVLNLGDGSMEKEGQVLCPGRYGL
jgi:mannosyl-glycoprotein endo-beta-N-acetylglucosaminidase